MAEAERISEAAAVARIKRTLGPQGWLEDTADTAKYRTDWRGRHEGAALLVARPGSTAEVAVVVGTARAGGIAIVPQGGNTGLVLGSVPTEDRPTILLSLDRMTGVRSLDAENNALIAEAGCVIQSLQVRAADVDRLFPLSLASEGSCTVGGALSTNAGGNQTIRFGNAREQVLGLEVVLPDGTVLDGLDTLRKNNTGYDLKHLFIGAEGTLGVITAAALRLMPRPKTRETAFLAVPDPAAAHALLQLARELSGDTVLAFELLPRYSIQLALDWIEGIVDPLTAPSPWYVLMELATPSPLDDLRGKLETILGRAMSDGVVTDGTIAENERQRRDLWRPREEQAEAGRRAGWGVGGDVSVPVARVAAFLEDSQAQLSRRVPGLEFNTFGHMGDGNIHYTMRKPQAMEAVAWDALRPSLSEQLVEIVAAYGGSFSAEHGIGAEKRATLARYKAPAALALMRTVKAAIDPDGLMNPGKLFL